MEIRVLINSRIYRWHTVVMQTWLLQGSTAACSRWALWGFTSYFCSSFCCFIISSLHFFHLVSSAVSCGWCHYIFCISGSSFFSLSPSLSLHTAVGVTHRCFPLSREQKGGRKGPRESRWKFQRGEMEDKNWKGEGGGGACQCLWGGEESSMKAAWLSTNWMSPCCR